MSLNNVTLTGTIPGGAGCMLVFTPGSWLVDTVDHENIPPKPVFVTADSGGKFSVSLLGTDNSAPAPGGWTWTVGISGIEGVAPYSFSFFLPFTGGATQSLDELAPVEAVTAMAAYLPLQYPNGAQAGYVWTSDDAGDGAWRAGTSAPVSSVNGKTGTVVLAYSDVGADPAGAAASAQSAAQAAAAAYANATFVPVSVLPLPVAEGGTGAVTAGAALTALGGAVATALTAETSRATTAEGTLSSGVSANATAITTETTRAEAAEAVLMPLLTRTAVQTGTYTATAWQLVPVDTTTGAVTINTPNGAASGVLVCVKLIVMGAGNNATIQLQGSDVLNKAGGGSTYTLSAASQGVLLLCNGSGIWTVVSDDLPVSYLNTLYDAAGAATSALTSAQAYANANFVPLSSLPLSLAHGGTGQIAQQAAMDALAGAQAAGRYLRSDGTHTTLTAIAAADLPAASMSTQGAVKIPAATVNYKPLNPASTVSGTLVMMGTGATCAFTPLVTGKVRIDVRFDYYLNTAVNNLIVGGRYGVAASTTIGVGSNGGEISTIATWGGTFGGNGTLDVASTAGFPATGTLYVAASGTTTAVVTYTGVSGNTFTGCAYVSGSATGTVTTGGAVTTIPPNGVTVIGTRYGASADSQLRPGATTGSSNGVPCSFTDILNLTAGTTYYFDEALAAGNTADAVAIQNISMTIEEKMT